MYADEAVPLTITLAAPLRGRARKMMVLLPASGLSARASFFTAAAGPSLASELLARGYVVLALTWREDRVGPAAEQSVLASWGVAKHTADVRRVVRAVERAVPLRYDLLGHSFTGAVVLDYASRYRGALDRAIILDFYSLGPNGAETRAGAARLYDGFVQLAEGGIYADTSLGDLKQLIYAAAAYPTVDSGMARDFIGVPGNFTFEGLLHFWLVYTAPLPGVHTEITGLPRDWPLILSTFAGYYVPALDPAADSYGFGRVDVAALTRVADAMGSGTIPLALMRDCAALSAQNGAYVIDWSGIDEELIWINAELGYGDFTHAAELVRAAGNDDVQVIVVPGYGNADPLFSRTASADVWSYFLSP